LKLPAPAITEETCGQLTAGAVTDGCLTGTLSCDQTVVGHTLGGVKRFDTAFWREHKCWPDTVNHDSGDERGLPPHAACRRVDRHDHARHALRRSRHDGV
jgi:hypothetical protein